MRYSNKKYKKDTNKFERQFSQVKVIKEINRLSRRSNKQFELLLYHGLPIRQGISK